MSGEPLWDDEKALKQRAFGVYVLYLAGFFTAGVTAVIGAVLAFLSLKRANRTFLESHFESQLKTFWICTAICAAGVFSFVVLIGFLIGWMFFLAAGLYLIYRSVLGLLHLKDNKPL